MCKDKVQKYLILGNSGLHHILTEPLESHCQNDSVGGPNI